MGTSIVDLLTGDSTSAEDLLMEIIHQLRKLLIGDGTLIVDLLTDWRRYSS